MHLEADEILQLARYIEGTELIELHSGDREPGARLPRKGQQWLVEGLKLLAAGDIVRLTAECDRLRTALQPFANSASSGVVKDALSFGDAPPDLHLTRGFGSVTISAQAFKNAHAALAATPPPPR